MKALFYNFPKKKFILKDAAVPLIKRGQALVKITASALCGSDLHMMQGPLREKEYNRREVILGHSFAGVIEAVGRGVKNFKKGDRVFASDFVWCGQCVDCRAGNQNLCDNRYIFGMETPGAHAEFLNVPDKSLFILPATVSFEEGALICDQVALVCHAARIANPKKNQKAAIFGAGPVGLTMGEVLSKKYKLKDIIFFDPSPWRRQLVKKYGFRAFKTKAVTRFIGKTEIVFDASGSLAALEAGWRLLKRGGKLVMIGVPNGKFELEAIKWISRELTLFGIFNYSQRDIKTAQFLVQTKKINLKKMITHRFSLAKGALAYRLLANKKAGKIILNCQNKVNG